jgi:hypothetical protein
MRDLTSRYSVSSRYIWLAISMGLMLGGGCGRSAATEASGTQSQQMVHRLGEVVDTYDLHAGKVPKGVESANWCPTSDCGTNGPIVNRFPVNGLHANGYKNAQGVWLVPGSIQGSRNKACDDHTLDVDGAGKLIAAGAEGCTDRDLDGASFKLKKTDPSTQVERIIELVIHAADPVKHYEHEVRGYKFTLRDSQQSVCDSREAKKIANALSLRKSPRFQDASGLDPDVAKADLESGTLDRKRDNDKAISEIAIVFSGELYDAAGRMLKGSERGGWFNIACARDALAKLDILKIAPHVSAEEATPEYYKIRAAGLRMMTANYCNNERYTFDGTEIEWAPFGSAQIGTCVKAAPDDRTLEAVWDENGAVCIEHTRLYAHRNRTDFRHLFPKPCQKLGTCQDERALVSALWSECDNVKHSCEGITGEFCSYSSTSE